jgi:hypothetical protein
MCVVPANTVPVIPALRQAQDRPAFGRAGIHLDPVFHVLGVVNVKMDPGFRRDDERKSAAERQPPAIASTHITHATGRFRPTIGAS